jgi:hypothetical protein
MTKDGILAALQKEVEGYNKIIATENGDWIVKGFIDIFKKIYSISIDTKVVSKVLEILLEPSLRAFADRNNLLVEVPAQQNHYPDFTFISKQDGKKFAVDIKSGFTENGKKLKNKMTLGSYTGYFRERNSIKSSKYPYSDYECHLVLGVIYSQSEEYPNKKHIYTIDELDKIVSVIRDFKFFVQPKYKVVSDAVGSGNTKNMGSIQDIKKIMNGEGIFSILGEEVYNDYWMFYLNKDMAKKLDIPRPYTNLKTYLEYKQRGTDILAEHKEEIEQFIDEDDVDEDGTETENGEQDDE